MVNQVEFHAYAYATVYPSNILRISCIDSLPHLTVVDCGNLTNPTNGQVNHTAGTTFGQTATYSCDTGYTLEGDNSRICQADGMWSGSEPTCISESSMTVCI